MGSFTEAKAKTRELNLKALKTCLGVSQARQELRYFGLPSPGMEDVAVLSPFLGAVHAVERGMRGREWKWQHDVAVEALVRGYRGFRLYRGDIDVIICTGQDEAGSAVDWPFDVVNLDYSGGITYKDETGSSKRLEAIKTLLREQGERLRSFFLIITVNDRHHDEGEITRVLDDLLLEARSSGACLDRELQAIKSGGDRRPAIFLYTAYVVLNVGRQWFRVEPFRPIFYTGSRDYAMVNMSFCLKHVAKRDAPVRQLMTTQRLVSLEPIVLA